MATWKRPAPTQAPLIDDTQPFAWPTPAPARPKARTRPAPDTRETWQRIASEPWPEHAYRMRELMRRVRAGEDFETVKRELWADQYRGAQE